MRYLKQIKRYPAEATFVGLIFVFFFLYFVIYVTPSRIAWYNEMAKQMTTLYYDITHIGRQE